MQRAIAITVLLASTICCRADTGIARTNNFSVLVEGDQQFARQVANAAEKYRTEIAREWFGREVPGPRTVLTVYIDDAARGLTWTKAGCCHRAWVTARNEAAVFPILKHEVCHTVFAAKYGDNRPPCEEAIAYTYDAGSTPELRANLQRRLREWEQTQ